MAARWPGAGALDRTGTQHADQTPSAWAWTVDSPRFDLSYRSAPKPGEIDSMLRCVADPRRHVASDNSRQSP